MHIIGVIGGVASGKSAIAAAFAQRGAVVFSGDALAHAVLDEPDVRDALVARWGDGILGADGRIARPAVAKIVFAHTPVAADELRFLEQLVHPRVRRRVETAISQLPASIPAVVIDAALLLEAGWVDLCTVVVFVDCPRPQRLQRALARGWTDEEFARREAAQMPIDVKRRRADLVIDNSGSLADLEVGAARCWDEAIR